MSVVTMCGLLYIHIYSRIISTYCLRIIPVDPPEIVQLDNIFRFEDAGFTDVVLRC